ncbi:MAG: CoA-binding protein [Candidatus Kariarchaeaceae archaeon]|jgi:predicted CoA-binding protein
MTTSVSIKDIEDFLRNPGIIVIVGASTKSEKAGFFVPKYLRKIGFDTILVNPKIDEIDGIRTFKSLDDINLNQIKGIIIYRKLPFAEDVAIKAINLGIPTIWLPDKITSEKAKNLASQNNIRFIQDDCPLRRGNQLKITT